MNPSNIIQGFAILAQAISDSNQATLRGLANLEERSNERMDNLERRSNERMDNLEQRVNERMDNGFNAILSLINDRLPPTN